MINHILSLSDNFRIKLFSFISWDVLPKKFVRKSLHLRTNATRLTSVTRDFKRRRWWATKINLSGNNPYDLPCKHATGVAGVFVAALNRPCL